MKGIKIAGFIIGLIVFIILFLFITTISNKGNREGDKQEIVVAAKEIPAMTVITADMLTVKKVEGEFLSSGNIMSKKEALGMVANTKILVNEPIISQKLTSADNSSLGIAPSVAEGKRAVSVIVEMNTGLSGLLRSGNFVDVLTSYDTEGTPDPNATLNSVSYLNGITVTLAQNAKVIALAQLTDAEKQNKAIENSSGTKEIYGTVTLEVSPAEAILIASSEIKGKSKIMLILRSQNDRNIMQIPGQVPGR